jgi:hypothetical protein
MLTYAFLAITTAHALTAHPVEELMPLMGQL